MSLLCSLAVSLVLNGCGTPYYHPRLAEDGIFLAILLADSHYIYIFMFHDIAPTSMCIAMQLYVGECILIKDVYCFILDSKWCMF